MDSHTISVVPQVQEIRYTGGFIRIPNEERTRKAAEEIAGRGSIDEKLAEESYTIRITPEEITLRGGSRRALFYAGKTLEQIFLTAGEEIPCLEIEDAPACAFRSFHLDCARHFIPAEEVKKMIDMAGYFHFNHFHWHLTDDQGWRIESRRFPKLNEIGSVRKGDHFGNTQHTDETECHYYTQEEIRDIVRFAAERGMEVIPEIDMPGHASALLASYPELACAGHRSEVKTTQGIYPDLICAGREETYIFLYQLLDEVCELFPGRYFHIGGDEAPKDQWKTDPECQELMRRENLEDERALEGYFENRIAAHLQEKGKTVIAWNEAAEGGNLSHDIRIQIWKETRNDVAVEHMKAGGKIILSRMQHAYCDYPYGFISLQSMYEIPLHPEELLEAPQENIDGFECTLWTEFVRSADRLEQLAWPRFAATAEAGWCGDRRPGYADFAERMKKVLPLFAAHGVAYTEPEGWVPGKEEAQAQMGRFLTENFDPEVLARMKKAHEEI